MLDVSVISKICRVAPMIPTIRKGWQRSCRDDGLVSTLLLIALLASPARAARLAGVTLPDTANVGGTALVLNGIGLRTYSVMAVPIYVADLYLQTPSHDADAILASFSVKLLVLQFVRNVPAAKVRDAGHTGLLNNCI